MCTFTTAAGLLAALGYSCQHTILTYALLTHAVMPTLMDSHIYFSQCHERGVFAELSIFNILRLEALLVTIQSATRADPMPPRFTARSYTT